MIMESLKKLEYMIYKFVSVLEEQIYQHIFLLKEKENSNYADKLIKLLNSTLNVNSIDDLLYLLNEAAKLIDKDLNLIFIVIISYAWYIKHYIKIFPTVDLCLFIETTKCLIDVSILEKYFKVAIVHETYIVNALHDVLCTVLHEYMMYSKDLKKSIEDIICSNEYFIVISEKNAKYSNILYDIKTFPKDYIDTNFFASSVYTIQDITAVSKKTGSDCSFLKHIIENRNFVEWSDNSCVLFDNSYGGDANQKVLDSNTVNIKCFGIVQFYDYGLLFLSKCFNWKSEVQQMSSYISSLNVKKHLLAFPAINKIYGYRTDFIECFEVSVAVQFIRLQILQVDNTVCHCVSLDFGTFLTCKYSDLIVLPLEIVKLDSLGIFFKFLFSPFPDIALIMPFVELLCCFVSSIAVPTVFASNLCDLMIQLSLKNGLEGYCLTLVEALLQKSCTREVDVFLALIVILRRLVYSSAAENIVKVLLKLLQRILLNCEGARAKIEYLNLYNTCHILQLKFPSLSVMSVFEPHLRKIRSQKIIINKIKNSNITSEGDSSLFIMDIANKDKVDRYFDKKYSLMFKEKQLVMYDKSDLVHNQDLIEAPDDSLRIGQVFRIKNNATHHILKEDRVNALHDSTLLKIIVGMLNSGKGGKIYFGLNNSGIVKGIKMTRDEKDRFLLGIYKLVSNEIKPFLLPCDSLVKFIPVYSRKENFLDRTDLYVIVIIVRPELKTFYTPKHEPSLVLVRQGGVSNPLQGYSQANFLKEVEKWEKEQEDQVCLEKMDLLKVL